jgi:NAD(P)-dependent dehydrogenase (short-subunit alcohol dehydrogenase family)
LIIDLTQERGMMGILDGKVAIVTGAGKGIGEGEALALAKEGAAVAVLARTFADVQRTAETIESLGARALPLACDVRIAEQVNAAVDATVKRFGRVDILVNNAQIMPAQHAFETWTEQEMRDMWESGLLGSWLFMMACLPHMKAQGGGRIINTCSAAGHGLIKGYVGYSTAKEAIRSLTRCAAREWGEYNINVNCISPVAMSAAGLEFYGTEEKRQALYDALGSAIRRFGDAEADVGRTVVFLAGPDSKQITGCTIGIDGGSAML